MGLHQFVLDPVDGILSEVTETCPTWCAPDGAFSPFNEVRVQRGNLSKRVSASRFPCSCVDPSVVSPSAELIEVDNDSLATRQSIKARVDYMPKSPVSRLMDEKKALKKKDEK